MPLDLSIVEIAILFDAKKFITLFQTSSYDDVVSIVFSTLYCPLSGYIFGIHDTMDNKAETNSRRKKISFS